ncbi:MAG TPA: tRNA pseudouridine(55) synthase TruB [Acidimicrobiales bacterium]|nr:tRNA pseudouridine(55) synthase TruB [Acidimicrobiales bacterium]
MVDGLAVVDKPAGMTSHDVVGRCRKVFGLRKVGHAGTLDPDATGVLLVGLGRATRLMQFMSGLTKSYRAEVVLGVATSTLDASGEVTGRWDMTAVTLEQARQAAAGFTGDIQQVPPMVSAVKVGGRRLHQLARSGIEVERPARAVTVSRFAVERVVAPGPVVDVSIDCSSGTYIRVLAADLGEALGGGAHVRALRRTAVGPWTTTDAVPLDELDASIVRPLADCLPWLAAVKVDQETAEQVGNGRVMELPALGIGSGDDGPWSVVGPDGDLLAVYQAHRPGTAKPAVVMAGPR